MLMRTKAKDIEFVVQFYFWSGIQSTQSWTGTIWYEEKDERDTCKMIRKNRSVKVPINSTLKNI